MADAQPAPHEESGPGPEIMRLLEQALRPVEPHADFMSQLEGKLANIEAAALEALEEVADWEFDALRDPRNWVRPVAAVAVGTAAGAALVVLGLRSRKKRAHGLRALAESGGKVANEALSSARGLIR
ncbi:MAG TPA: hypothetical protein VFB51_06915 [Solirubrobacterales bacterium]|nr:hypothetical protein [Solirubrobacterales bacterium]